MDEKVELPEPLARGDDRQDRLAAHRRLMAAVNASRERGDELDRKFARLADRVAYRKEREAAGGTVRAYRSTKQEPRLPGEDDEAFKARIHCERQRERRGVSGDTVRNYTDLSALSPEQKAQHKKDQAAERKRRGRAKARAGKCEQSVEPEVLALLNVLDISDRHARRPTQSVADDKRRDDPPWGIF